MRRGFSLVELSIVLVILGLLVGGILAGQSLIRASELRSVISESQRYLTAVHAFKDKYLALPGDMANATGIWGARDNGDGLGTDCTDLTTAETTTRTCNGNADGKITNYTNSERHEAFHIWKQLANAGLIEGNYAGAEFATNSRRSVIGWNVPASRLTGGGWSIIDSATSNGTGVGNMQFAGYYGNTLFFGGATVGETVNPILRTEEAWNTDKKLDDGLPGYGKVLSGAPAGGSWAPDCSTTNSAATAQYKLTFTDIACPLMFKLGL